MKQIVLIVMFIINLVFPIIMEYAQIKFKNTYDTRDAITLNTFMVCMNINVMGFLYFD